MTQKTCSECGQLGHNKKRHAPPSRTSRSHQAADMVDRVGCDLRDAALRFGITVQAVSQIMVARHGRYRTPGIDRRSALSEQREIAVESLRGSVREGQAAGRNAAVDLVRSGRSIASVSGETGFSYHAIWAWCIEAGVRSRPSLPPSPRPGQVSKTALALRMMDSGLTQSEAARRVGMSPQALRRGERRRNGEIIR